VSSRMTNTYSAKCPKTAGAVTFQVAYMKWREKCGSHMVKIFEAFLEKL
jgi:hypothetical protein